MPHRSTRALTAAIVGATVVAAPSPAFAADAKYPGDYCEDSSGNVAVPDFDASVSRSVVRAGQPTTYTLRFRDPFNHVEVDFFANGEYVSGTIIHHEETAGASVTIRPREDTTISWSGAIFCSPDMHYDMVQGLSPVTVSAIQPRRPWNRLAHIQRSIRVRR